MQKIVLATQNPGKLREIRAELAALPVEVDSLESYPEIPEPEETAETFAGNARDKAAYYARAIGGWALADDSGLVVDALGGAPGVYSARYAADRCPPDASRDEIDAANNARLLEELGDTPDEQRTARFVCHLAMSDGERTVLETFDTIEGRIGHVAAGENGFGYDPLFIADETGCTTAQLSPREKNAISHRGKAVRHFAGLLRSLLESQRS